MIIDYQNILIFPLNFPKMFFQHQMDEYFLDNFPTTQNLGGGAIVFYAPLS